NTSLPANIYPGIIRFRSPNELWAVGTDGYYLFNGTQWLHYTMENANLPSNILTDIAFDEDITWFTSEEGAIKLQNGIYTTYQTSNSGLPYNQCNCIAVDSFHNVWIGTCHMLAKFNYTGWTIYSTGNTPLQNNVIDKMVIDCYNNLWIGIPITIKPENLLKFDGENWTTYYPAICPLTLNTVKHFSLGSDGSVWFNCLGEFDGCVLKYDFENWTFYNCENIEMPCPCARAIVCDDSLNTYLATCIGVVKITPTGTVQYPGTIYRPGAITLDNNSTLWLGNSAYFSHWNGQGWTIYSETDIGHPIGQTEILRKDNFGNIWFGTQNGLFCYNNGTWEFYNAASNCLYSHWVKDIYIQADNSLWIADSALTYFDGNIWTHYTCENSPFLHNNVSAVTMDANQVLWIGT
ncbi:MAG TPA: hypothetical protein PLW71_04085, partial [Candidatus Syntrophosphaera thermopropionivorans]|nr:hypothetical protein [Candidatus Syntrophosphaera thermopropionivorans]